jgi:hypothetical protein
LELFHIRPKELNDDRVGRALDTICPYINDIEETIVLHCLSRFGEIDTSRILWDLTSFCPENCYSKKATPNHAPTKGTQPRSTAAGGVGV